MKADIFSSWESADLQQDRSIFQSLSRCLTGINSSFITGVSKLINTTASILYFNAGIEDKKDKQRRLKSDFYFKNQSRRSNISRRAWKRHSALLSYCLQQDVLHLSEGKLENGTDSTQNTIPEISQETIKGSMSFTVTSIRLLPVWSSSLIEMSLIEQDLSSLACMKNYKPTNLIEMKKAS